MPSVPDHPLRAQLVGELHARPFPTLTPPCRAAFLAIKQPENAVARDRRADLAHLTALLDHYSAPHPEDGATHYFGPLGKFMLKWESHTEFVTYTLFADGVAEVPFDGTAFAMFPSDWLAAAPGARLTSALVRVEVSEGTDGIAEKLENWFVSESLAVAHVLDDTAIVASDFRIDPNGHIRLAVFARSQTGRRRIGRVVQRLCEIETYKTMSMLGLMRVRAMGPQMGAIDNRLNGLTEEMLDQANPPEQTLQHLIGVSAELENLGALSSFRFGATRAYEAIVGQRIEVLREARFGGRQTFAEFMMRRFDPAMRTVKATERRLEALTARAERASNLLRTRVDVDHSLQNQTLLQSMDKRAALQLRLQRTVEGLSVVAISYYAVGLILYMLEPLGTFQGISKPWVSAIVTPLVVLGVWGILRWVRRDMKD